ncbi:uncharacterized protein LOC101452978 [Ceratitis capitata]|uniref:(Mediterranean fruit fly) hypothetical protein n=1 Tax=Ceratitis capitata TaxID=7213 RepID=W8CA56_CERCA|nr:uncharacterized protein LOC101452978 [Ceratitis capitata]CAD6993235.1 unnamed protein product [Ceratitis capitata]
MCEILAKFLSVSFLLLNLYAASVNSLCLATEPPTCLTNLDDEDAKEILDYVLKKYEEVDMKITGEPLAVRGKRISSGGTEEFHIAFHYVDNTPGDVIQNCAFVVVHAPNSCETISTVCNTFLPVTPRPLLKLEDLTVCDDGEDQARPREDIER